MARENTNGQVAESPAVSPPAENYLTFELSLEQTRALVDLAQQGLLAAAKQGDANGGDPAARSALAILSGAAEEMETISSVRTELETAGFQTGHLDDNEVAELARRIADIPHRGR
jgi:hypothetical protein